MELRQRSLVNRRVTFRDAELTTNYVFPFWDGSWSVRFVLIEVLGGDEPRVLSAPLRADGSDLRTDARAEDARPLGQIPRSEFATVYHFDPWWIFRGKGGRAAAYRDVIVATNISRPFLSGGSVWSVHDVTFAPLTDAAVAIEAKDPLFRKRAFTNGTLDLAKAFGAARPRAEVEAERRSPSPKVL